VVLGRLRRALLVWHGWGVVQLTIRPTTGLECDPRGDDNFYWFLRDLKSYGIQRVTPTPVFDDWSGPGSMKQCRPNAEACQPGGNGLYFLPWLPYGLDPFQQNFPDRRNGNRSYFDSAQTPSDIFWGWDRFLNLMNRVLAKAAAAGLEVKALDYFQESNMAFTVQARIIYDNYRNVDVLQELRSRMSNNGFDPGRVAPSANIPPSPTPASADCLSWYGDSAMLLTLSELMVAIAGQGSAKGIGDPPGHPENGLVCYQAGDPVPEMVTIPKSHGLPTFIDIHTQKTFGAATDTATWAKNFYGDVWSFLGNWVMAGSYVVFGETNPVEQPLAGEPCRSEWIQWTAEQAQAMLFGMPGADNGYKNSTLFTYHAADVVMRPWHRTEYVHSYCVPSPNVINPPYNPFAP